MDGKVTEDYPVHEQLKIVDGHTVYKNSSWWKAIVLLDGFRGLEVGVYLWKKTDEKWTRKQKYLIRSEEDWKQECEIIDDYTQRLTGD